MAKNKLAPPRNKRAKNLDDKTIDAIVRVLDGWSGKLTWDLFIEQISRRLHQTYTRQALNAHERIKNAFQLHKGNKPLDKESNKHFSSVEDMMESQRNARLVAENARLERENHNLLEQFARWAYNAHTKGISEEDLNKALPKVHR
jgi:phosphoketolase